MFYIRHSGRQQAECAGLRTAGIAGSRPCRISRKRPVWHDTVSGQSTPPAGVGDSVRDPCRAAHKLALSGAVPAGTAGAILAGLKNNSQAELQNSSYPQTISQPQSAGSVDDDVLGFAAALQEKKVKKAERMIRYFDMLLASAVSRRGLDLAGGFSVYWALRESTNMPDASYRAIHAPGKEEVYPDSEPLTPKNSPTLTSVRRLPLPGVFYSWRGKDPECKEGTLFFELAKWLKRRGLCIFFLRTSLGSFSHDRAGRFGVILSALYDLGYHVRMDCA